MLSYHLSPRVEAFTLGVGALGTAPGTDARLTGLAEADFSLSRTQLMIPRQTHSVHVAWVETSGEVADTDAVITSVPGLCVAVKTADCIPVLLYDERQHLVAAVHAGWRGTVGRIVERTLEVMKSRGEDVHAIIGPGISLQAFEVGDEVYEAFQQASFPMSRIAQRFSKWHLDLWEANRYLLEQYGVKDIHTAGICTYTSSDFYSARRDSIRTGRNINGIRLLV